MHRKAFVEAKIRNAELKKLRSLLPLNKHLTADELLGESPRFNLMAQLTPNTILLDNLLLLKQKDDPERELFFVPADIVAKFIRYYPEGPGGAHQAEKTTSSNIIRLFFNPS